MPISFVVILFTWSIFAVVRSSETTKTSYGRPKDYINSSAGRLKFDLMKKKKQLLSFLTSYLRSDHLSSIHNFSKTEHIIATFCRDKIIIMAAILADAVFSINEIIAGSIFKLSTADILYCSCIRENTRRWHQLMFWSKFAVILIWHRQQRKKSTNTSEKQTKYSMNKKRKSILFFRGCSHRGPGFHLFLHHTLPQHHKPLGGVMFCEICKPAAKVDK